MFVDLPKTFYSLGQIIMEKIFQKIVQSGFCEHYWFIVPPPPPKNILNSRKPANVFIVINSTKQDCVPALLPSLQPSLMYLHLLSPLIIPLPK